MGQRDDSIEELRHLQRVRERAYALYVARHGEGGTALEDWARAEKELADTIRTVRPAFAQPVTQQIREPEAPASTSVDEATQARSQRNGKPVASSPRGR